MARDVSWDFELSESQLYDLALRSAGSAGYVIYAQDRMSKAFAFKTGMTFQVTSGVEISAVVVPLSDRKARITFGGGLMRRRQQLIVFGNPVVVPASRVVDFIHRAIRAGEVPKNQDGPRSSAADELTKLEGLCNA